MTEFFGYKILLLEKQFDKILFIFQGKYHLLSSCFICKKIIFRRSQKKYFYTKHHYCSRTCYENLKKKETSKKICTFCKAAYLGHGKSKYCSEQCKVLCYKAKLYSDEYHIINNHKHKLLLLYKNCLYLATYCKQCNKSIFRKTKRTIYDGETFFACSQKCRYKLVKAGLISAKETIKINCDFCNKEFWFYKRLINSSTYNFCEDKCAYEAQKKGGAINNLYTQTLIKKYGVTSPLSVPAFKEKAEKTLAKNKIKNQISKPEQKFLENFLLQIFPRDDIEQQKYIKFWPIDFYIKSLNAYIQIDGAHIHGLDKSLKAIKGKAKTSKHYKGVLHKVKLDERRVIYFKENNIKMIRISDEFILRDVDFVFHLLDALKQATSAECYEYNIEFANYYREMIEKTK